MTRKDKSAGKCRYSRRAVERTVYLVLIVLVALYGLVNSQAAVSLLGAIKDAFSLLINTATP
jgi:hypothetical protein